LNGVSSFLFGLLLEFETLDVAGVVPLFDGVSLLLFIFVLNDDSTFLNILKDLFFQKKLIISSRILNEWRKKIVYFLSESILALDSGASEFKCFRFIGVFMKLFKFT
jgi:hypothetical protein